MPAPLEPTLTLAQARSRWGTSVVVASLFRPGPDPRARNGLTKAVTRRSNRRSSSLPARLLLAVDDDGRALICPLVADAQGGHPEGDDLYAGPFEELGAVAAGPISIVLLLDAGRPAVLEAVWADHDAATVAALLTGEPLPDEPDLLDAGAGGGEEDDDEDPHPDALLAAADVAQARADALRALAAAARAEDAAGGPPPPLRPPPPEEPGPSA